MRRMNEGHQHIGDQYWTRETLMENSGRRRVMEFPRNNP